LRELLTLSTQKMQLFKIKKKNLWNSIPSRGQSYQKWKNFIKKFCFENLQSKKKLEFENSKKINY